VSEQVPCRFCGKPAVAVFKLPEGCLVFKNDREQALCPQHVVSATPIGAMTLSEVLIPEVWDWMRGEVP
jgi:hypothetical protein